jgi:hypothetical protein
MTFLTELKRLNAAATKGRDVFGSSSPFAGELADFLRNNAAAITGEGK